MEQSHSHIGNDSFTLPDISCHKLTPIETDLSTGLLDTSNPGSFNQLNQSSPDFGLFDATPSSAHPAMTSFDSKDILNLSDPQTVSPRDLLIDYPSAPPSSAFTNLSTPQTYTFDSPSNMVHSTDTSPMFQTDELDDDADNWASLFPTEDTNEVQSSIETTSASPAMQRTVSSPNQHVRHSSISGVKSRKRDKPLPTLDYNREADPVVRKRMKNTEAARKSRAKKQERFDLMQDRIDYLEAEVEHWKTRALESETHKS